jgi:Leucine-rich repeat (LRR) protein
MVSIKFDDKYKYDINNNNIDLFILKNNNFHFYDNNDTPIWYNTFEEVLKLQNYNDITHLYLGDQLNDCVKINRLPSKLIFLSFNGAQIGDLAGDSIDSLPESLLYLELSCCSFTDDGEECKIKYLNNMPKNIKIINDITLREKDISNLPISLLILSCTLEDNIHYDFSHLVNLKSLHCGGHDHSQITLPNSLIKFRCHIDKNIKIYNLPNSLKSLEYHKSLVSLPELPDSLEILICSNNKIEELPKLPNSLEILDCSNNNIKELPKLPSSLKKLICNTNDIKNLPALPNNLLELNITDTFVKYLPILPKSLKLLLCINCSLQKLPELPDSLEILDCSHNFISQITRLPKSLINLNCDNNNISELTNLPEKLITLTCDNNNISELSNLPGKINYISCINNNNLQINEKLPRTLKNLKKK